MEKETKQVSKFIIEKGDNEYVFEGGGSSVPQPDSVGTEQIQDNSVKMEDLNTEVKDKMRNTYDSENEGIKLGGL